ncbi:hypothetical protein [Nocardia sp. CNY236]|uniref:hypothetical protein n=1 Tax=Nocardia sp. CNY236 TaxID=1169152 RepID=UPI001E5B08B3|nr:hypothetical protein [Nocardia sp. CNY236]
MRAPAPDLAGFDVGGGVDFTAADFAATSAGASGSAIAEALLDRMAGFELERPSDTGDGAVCAEVDGDMLDSFLAGEFDWVVRAGLRAGLVSVTSIGEKDSTSFDPVGRTRRKSPSSGLPSATTLPERPSGTPTAAAVNHTMGGWPPAISVAIC